MNPIFNCKAVFHIRKNGKTISPGQPIQLTQDEIDDLGSAAVTVVSLAEPNQQQASDNKAAVDLTHEGHDDVPEGAEDPAEQINRLVLEIGHLDKEDESLWAKGGEPKVAPLELLVDFDVTAEMRDAAWAIVLEQAE